MRGIYLALGGNLGDREKTLQQAQELLAERGVRTIKASSLYENPALLPEAAPKEWDIPFLNQVLEVETTLAPEPLLEALKAVEKALGRVASERWSPRPVDIDILAYHDIYMQSQRLSVPHPEWHKRDFVVVPWHEIAPNWQWHDITLASLAPQFATSPIHRYVA